MPSDHNFPNGTGIVGSPILKRVNHIDAQVGARIRKRRIELGLTQEQLASTLDVTFQQVQKYERGANRVSASRLHAITRILRVPVAYFFDEASYTQSSEEELADLVLFLDNSDCRQLNEAFRRIGDTFLRKRIISLMEALGSHRPGSAPTIETENAEARERDQPFSA